MHVSGNSGGNENCTKVHPDSHLHFAMVIMFASVQQRILEHRSGRLHYRVETGKQMQPRNADASRMLKLPVERQTGGEEREELHKPAILFL